MRTRDLRSATSLGAGLGLLAAIFSAAEFYDAQLRGICSVSSFFSCALVDKSGLTTTLGIQDYLWGIGGFVAILLFAAIAERRAADPRWTYFLTFLTTLGIALALYFLYVELALIHAVCLVCAADYLFGGVAWLGSLALSVRAYRGTLDDPPEPSPDADD
ncbi:MAG TPA: vitamin K epoxide reductase family protein [Thermoplasmata archaeon]|nr:vitamin K epoxide reductase family protein [Thermoplasmata archaeon]